MTTKKKVVAKAKPKTLTKTVVKYRIPDEIVATFFALFIVLIAFVVLSISQHSDLTELQLTYQDLRTEYDRTDTNYVNSQNKLFALEVGVRNNMIIKKSRFSD